MYDEEREYRRLYVASHAEDVPSISGGSLIPRHTIYSAPQNAPTYQYDTHEKTTWYMRPVVLITFSVFLFATSIGTSVYALFSGTGSFAAPIMYLKDEGYSPQPLVYGAKMELSEPDFYGQTRDTLIASSSSFIEADLTSMHITYYEEGESVFSAPILSKGREGSWWETPAGLYEIELKKENHFSSFGNVYQPWSMVFQGNFFIHGWPQYTDGTPVPEGYSGGCIRLRDEDAQALFDRVAVDTPVLVHEKSFTSDGFVYEPKVPELSAEHYLIADIESNSILASSDLDAQVPIASITKLMTALIASEYINLDNSVYLQQGSFITSLIPRLVSGSKVSMYSLLQLLLVESSNEAANTIAQTHGYERFISRMNQKAKSIGMTDTTFTDPSGLDNGNVSSIRDLFRLTQYIHHNRSFILKLTADQDLPTAYASGQFGELVNFNEIEGVNFIGGKVGETIAAGQTSVSLHTMNIKGEERIIAIVVLNASARADDIQKLFQYLKQRFSY